MIMDKWTWHMDTDLGEGKVNAQISSEDGKSKLKMANAPGKLVDSITSLLNSSYKWGQSEAEPVEVEATTESAEGSEDAIVEQKQTIANLRREVTNLKKLVEPAG